MADIRVYRETVIHFPYNPNIPDITTGIESGSLSLDEVLCTEGFTIGQCNANKFEVDVHDIPDIEKKFIEVYQMVKADESSTAVKVPLFYGRVDSCVRNRSRSDTSRHIVAYDALYYKAKINVTRYWKETFDAQSEITLKAFREGLCQFVNLPYDTEVVLPNDDLIIAKTQKIKGVSFIEMLKYICAIQACNANISRDGVLHFISTFSTYNITDNYEKNTSEFEAFTVPVFSQVMLDNSVRGTTATVGDGDKTICIQNNLLILDKTDAELEVIATTILNSVAKVSYNPAKINMIVSDYNIQLGSIVQTEFGNSLVCEIDYSGPLLIEQNIRSSGTEDYTEQSTIAGYQYSVTEQDLKGDIKITKEQYYTYTNAVALNVLDTQNKKIIDIRFTSTQATLAVFDAEILLDVDTQTSAVGKITYEINDAEVTAYHPTETWIDGKHILRLLYFIKVTSARSFKFVVKLNMSGGSASIPLENINAAVHGQGLVDIADWSGMLEFEETVSPFVLTSPAFVNNISEEVTVTTESPTGASLQETVSPFVLTSPQVVGFSETLFMDKKSMSSYTHAELAEYTHEQLNNLFIYG